MNLAKPPRVSFSWTYGKVIGSATCFENSMIIFPMKISETWFCKMRRLANLTLLSGLSLFSCIKRNLYGRSIWHHRSVSQKNCHFFFYLGMRRNSTPVPSIEVQCRVLKRWPHLSSLLVEIIPWCLVVNNTESNLYLRDLERYVTVHLPSGSVLAPHRFTVREESICCRPLSYIAAYFAVPL